MDKMDEIEGLGQAHNYVMTFHKELSKLLVDLDKIMSKESHNPIGGSGVWDQGSKSLDNPDFWMPYYVLRTYQDPTDKDVSRGIIILFRDFPGIDFPQGVIYGVIREKEGTKDRDSVWSLWKDNLDKIKNNEFEGLVSDEQNLRNLSGTIRYKELSQISSIHKLEEIAQELLSINV